MRNIQEPEEEICHQPQCHALADQAVKKVFSLLGVDVDNPESVEEFRQDLRFGKKIRKAADHGLMAVVAIFFVAIAAATWIGIVERVSAHK